MRREGVVEIERKLEELAPDMTFREFMNLVRDPSISQGSNGYGQATHLPQDIAHPDLHTLWVARTGSITAPFVPWRIGVTSVPPEFRKHRYRTKGSATTFVTAEARCRRRRSSQGGSTSG